MNMQEQVRVLRILEYTGDRKAVEEQLALSLHGMKDLSNATRGRLIIKAVTVDIYPELLQNLPIAQEYNTL